MADRYHHVCTSQPFCLCVGEVNEWDECCCLADDYGALRSVCVNCDAPTDAIDVDDGEPLLRAVSA